MSHPFPAGEAALLRVFLGSHDKDGGRSARPLYEAIVGSARAVGLAGATVIAAKMSFSRSGAFYSDLFDETLSDHRPLVVEIVDSPARLMEFLPRVHELVQGRRLTTLERAEIELYRAQSH